jgi:hypothetical protein
MKTEGKRILGYGYLAAALVLVLTLGACYPGSDRDSAADYDVVATWFDSVFDFGAARTYAMEEKVNHICPPPPEDPDCQGRIDRQYDQLMLDTVAANMASRGYERVKYEGPTTQTDLIVNLSVNSSLNVGFTCYYAWGGWYYWYPYCYPVPYAFTTGTLAIDMLDMSRRDAADQSVPAAWTAMINGLMNASVNPDLRIEIRINQSFLQSPYLRSNE